MMANVPALEERDDLITLIYRARHSAAFLVPMEERIADALLSAGYRKVADATQGA